jgi:ATP-binding cassette subfamily C protein
LLDVVLGILEPTSGTVLIDGTPLLQRLNEWQRSIGYVPQDVYLVDDTLRANVALGWYSDEIDEDRVLEAIRMAELTEVVAGLPDGLDTRLGERGMRLSGGQRQRVGVARALYTSPSVLVLDEATSNLDQATERQIVDTLTGLRGGLTMIVVTHRIASVKNCDRVIHLDEGTITALGSFEAVCGSLPLI